MSQSVQEILDQLTASDYEEIESLAASGHISTEIARILNVDVQRFRLLWNDPNSEVRKRYDLGILEIEANKMKKLADKAENGNITAIQQHDKKLQSQHFREVRSKVFGA